jgi:hypothetical protein
MDGKEYIKRQKAEMTLYSTQKLYYVKLVDHTARKEGRDLGIT